MAITISTRAQILDMASNTILGVVEINIEDDGTISAPSSDIFQICDTVHYVLHLRVEKVSKDGILPEVFRLDLMDKKKKKYAYFSYFDTNSISI